MISQSVQFLAFGLVFLFWVNISRADADEDEEPRSEKIEIGYDDGLYIKRVDGYYSLKIHFLMQPQYQNVVANGVDNTNTFFLRRVACPPKSNPRLS